MRDQSVKSVLGFFGWFVAKRSDALLLGALFGPIAVGLYRLATKLTEMVVDFTSSALNQVSLPDLASLYREPDRFVAKLARYAHTQSVIAFPLLGVIVGTAGPILGILGPEWTDAVTPVRILCVASAMFIVTSLLGTALMAAQRQGTEALFNWIHAAVSAAAIAVGAYLTWTSADRPRIMAIAIAAVATETVVVVAIWRVTFRHVLRAPGRPMIAACAPALLSGLVSASVGYGLLRLLPDSLGPVWEFLLATAAAGLAGLAVLLLTDAEVTRLLKVVLARLRGRRETLASSAAQEAG
jgi:PST family polysaccharide transporter